MQSFTTNEVTLTCLRHSSFSLYCILHSCWFVVGFLASSPGKTLALGLAEAEMENKIIDYKSIFRCDKARMYAVLTVSSSVGSRANATVNANVLIQSKVNKDQQTRTWLLGCDYCFVLISWSRQRSQNWWWRWWWWWCCWTWRRYWEWRRCTMYRINPPPPHVRERKLIWPPSLLSPPPPLPLTNLHLKILYGINQSWL